MRFRDIPQLTPWPPYRIDLDWRHLEEWIENNGESLDLDPDFQRAHVWTPEQQAAYVEFRLRGGRSGADIFLNCHNYSFGVRSPGCIVLVDGKQRVEAVRAFLRDEVPIFGGCVFSAFEGRLPIFQASFGWHINDLRTRADVLRWYLEINATGTPHTQAELEHVEMLLQKEEPVQ